MGYVPSLGEQFRHLEHEYDKEQKVEREKQRIIDIDENVKELLYNSKEFIAHFNPEYAVIETKELPPKTYRNIVDYLDDCIESLEAKLRARESPLPDSVCDLSTGESLLLGEYTFAKRLRRLLTKGEKNE